MNMEKTPTQTEQGPNKEKQVGFEIMKMPEIVVQEERGAQLFSLLLKAENPEWGETGTEITKEVSKYFEKNPVSNEIIETIIEFHENGVDEEALYNGALKYQHPERRQAIFEMIEKHKPHIKNPEESLGRLLDVLGKFDESFSQSPLAKKINNRAEQNKHKRLENLEEIKTRIEGMISFFQPDSKTTKMKKLSFVPTDSLYRSNSGRAFTLGDEQLVISHIDNIDNQDHEFCHGIINPIVDKLFEQLTDEQKQNILKLSNGKLKRHYETSYSVLAEELIRTYLEVFKKGEILKTYEDFGKSISNVTDEQFQIELNNNQDLRKECKELEIITVKDIQSKSKEYFDRFKKNQLRNIVFELYEEYSDRQNKETENFEMFILREFPKKI